MSEWIKHNGGPQPVREDVWVEFEADPLAYSKSGVQEAGLIEWCGVTRWRVINQDEIDAARLEGLQMGLKAFDEARLAVEGDIQKLCDAARLEGIRLGLEAAAKVVDAGASDWMDERESFALEVEADAIRALDPDTIAREAQGER